LPPVYLYFSYR